MNIREPSLPPGWYPRDPKEIDGFLLPFRKDFSPKGPFALAAIAPHAGWHYSGRIAASSVSRLERDAETVVVIGGHNPPGGPFLFAQEDAARTPLGLMPIDGELRDLLEKELGGRADLYRDNTVEVLLPMVHSFFPRARLLWTRFPGDLSSYEAGKALGKAAQTLNRRIAVLGSTDLTHYGDNYGFSPRGRGRAALDWARNTNDTAFIAAVLAGDPALVLKRANEDFSACSVGAVLGVLGFAHVRGAPKGKLLEYGTSADGMREIPGSFVGYAAMAWEKAGQS